VTASHPEPRLPDEPLEGLREAYEDLVAEIGSMMSVSSWSKVETEARRSAYSDVLAVISDRLAALAARPEPELPDEEPLAGRIDWIIARLLQGADKPAQWGVPEDYAAGWVAALHSVQSDLDDARREARAAALRSTKPG
jgi:hypothetical protein